MAKTAVDNMSKDKGEHVEVQTYHTVVATTLVDKGKGVTSQGVRFPLQQLARVWG